MRSILLIFLFGGMLLPFLSAQPAGRPVESAITGVTVFRQGAQVTRTARVSLPAGRSMLVFSGLSPQLETSSLQVGATGEFTILSVTPRINYLQPAEQLAEVKRLREQLRGLRDNLGREQAGLQALEEEENLLLANKAIGGQQSGVELEKLRAMAEFYRTRLTDIKLRKLETGRRIADLEEQIRQVESQLRTSTPSERGVPTAEVVISINVPRATAADFRIAYLVRRASWSPIYDLRVTDIARPAALAWKANVVQQTGEAWTGVRLTLSTGNPSEPGTRPELQPWWLRLYQPPAPVAMDRDALRKEDLATRAAPPPPPPPPYPAEEAAATGPLVVQQESTTTVEFRIAEPYDVPSDGKHYVVSIQENELPLEYEYVVTPKLDKDAFLTGRLVDWERLNLLSGPVNIFLEGTYVGQSALDVNNTLDTLTFSLGRDKGIVVSRTRQEEFTDRQFLGNKKTERAGWKIELRNTKSRAVRITVLDQIPLSTTAEIEVSLEESSGAALDAASGALRWNLELPPNASRTLTFRYAVKYPKKEKVVW